MRVISNELFIEAAKNATIRVVDGRAYISSSSVVHLRWNDKVDYVVLARLLFKTITAKEQILFFHEWGIWSSSENTYLFNLVAKTLFNEDITHPAEKYFQFSAEDGDAAQTLLQIGLQSGWGGLLFGEDNNWLYFDHGGFGIIASTAKVAEILGPMDGLTILPSDFRQTSQP